MTPREEIILLVQRLCRQVGSQTELGGMMGVSKAMISRWKNGVVEPSHPAKYLPLIRKTAEKLKGRPQTQGASERMWQTMRMAPGRRFTVIDLMITASVSQGVAKNFIARLKRFGYVRGDDRKPYQPGVYVRYTLAINSGPKVPRFRALGQGMFDPNLKKEVAPKDVA